MPIERPQKMVSPRHRTSALLIGLCAALALIGTASKASSQACFEHIRNLNYSPTNCTAQPEIDRVFRLQAITWRGHKYLFIDEGNEIRIRNIDSPLNPINTGTSSFNVPNVGDSDYDMVNFTVCDDCRFGMASFKAATVLFDLGTGLTPSFVAVHKNFTANLIQGGFTFKVGTQQYLIAAGLGAAPCTNNTSGLYQFIGINEAGNPLLECLDIGGTGTDILNGLFVGSADPPVLYMSDRFDRFRIFQTHTSPTFGLDYLGNGGIVRANMARGYGAAVDETAGLMAVANSGDLFIYDIGHTSGNPGSPVLRSTTALSGLTNANAVALNNTVVHVAQQFTTTEPQTYDISNPSNPVPLDQQFWDPSHAWNSLGACIWNNHAIFSDDGSALFLSRYSSLQVIDPTECIGPVEPLANLNLDPQPAFPDDLLTVTNTSSSGDSYATWITDGPSAHGDTILAGSVSMTTGTTLAYTLPADMASTDVFYAHAAVENGGFPYVPGGTPDQLKTVAVVIDRTPEAVIIIEPEVVVTGDTVNLNVLFEGHPAVPGGGDPFGWTVTDPSGTPSSYTGAMVSGVTLGQSGQWSFDLDVQYRHDAPSQPGLPYVELAQLVRNISSVSAAFTVSPANPRHNEIITLTSTSAAQAGANLDFDWDVLTTSGMLVHELAFCDGPGAVNEECVIPVGTLSPGTYDLRMTLTNTATTPDDVSDALIEDFEIYFWDPQIDFTWAPQSPGIGQFVGFNITGVSAIDIEQAEWSFGGTGCDGTSSYTCVEPNFPGCDQAAFAYESGGTKTVWLTLTITGGIVRPPVSHDIVVQHTGSCTSACGGVGPDDGTAENGYGWGTGRSFVQRFTPDSYPFVLTDVCAAFTQAAADTSLDFNVVVFADDGPDGSPGTILGGAFASIDDVPAWLNHIYASVEMKTPSLIIDEGSVHIGVEWDESTELGFYVAADESPGTAVQTGFFREESGGWIPISSTFPDYRSLLLRTDGYPISDGEWEMVVGSTIGGGNGFGDSDNRAATTMAAFDGALLVGTKNQDGGEVNFTTDGRTWILGNLPGFGTTTNESISALLPFDGGLYAATRNSVLGTETYRAQWTTDSALDWTSVTGPGTYDSFNVAAPSGAVFDGHLYLGTDHIGGCEIWRTADGTNWAQVHLNGFDNPHNQIAASMVVFHNELYVGTLNGNGAELWKSPDGIVWFPVATGGFGTAQTSAIADLTVFGGALYAGASNALTGAKIWRSFDGTEWELVVSNGFGNLGNKAFNAFAIGNLGLYASASGPSNPGAVWHSIDGTSWTPSSSPGFTDSTNETVGSLHLWNERVYAGTTNSTTGCEIWRGGRNTLFDDDFETGDTTGWTNTVP
jgi:hypothetical protein